MIRPAAFGFNTETANTNAFQVAQTIESDSVAQKARDEFDIMIEMLNAHEIDVYVFEDTLTPVKPDAVFSNNWISMHEDGTLVLYPMMAENRRFERRDDIVTSLKENFKVEKIIDLSSHENESQFLEGTGSIVFDHKNKIAYACRSARTNEALLQSLAKDLGYKILIFDAVDEQNQVIYHTNVMMCVGSEFAILCLDSIRNENDLDALLDSFANTGHQVISISYEQMKAFAGNMIEVKSRNNEPIVLLSQAAFDILLPGQINALSQSADLIPLRIPTIEKFGGGSVRCMVSGIHLPKRNP